MKRTILIGLLLATAACSPAVDPVDDAVAAQPINAVFMPDVVDEPDKAALNEQMKSPVSPQAQFVADHQDDSLCSTIDGIKAMAAEKLHMESFVEEDGYIVFYSGYADGGVRHAAVSPMEACFVDEEPTDHEHDSETGERK